MTGWSQGVCELWVNAYERIRISLFIVTLCEPQRFHTVVRVPYRSGKSLITSPGGATAKYCDEHVCVSVCLPVREDVSETTRAIFTEILCMLPMAVARSFSGRLKKSQWLSSPLIMHCTAEHLGPIQKQLNRSRCRLEWWMGFLNRGTVCYVGWRSLKRKGQFWGKTCARQA